MIRLWDAYKLMLIFSSSSWSDAERWIHHTLVPHLHRNPSLHLIGLPQIQYTHTLGHMANILLGNSSELTQQLLGDLHMADWRKTV